MDIKKIAIAGAGTMGYSIAEIFAEYGYDIVLYDISEDALDNAEKKIKHDFLSTAHEKNLSEDDISNIMAKITYNKDMVCFKDADMVIECIIENLDIKKSFYSEISNIVSEDTILATNTSGISINDISKSVKNPQRFIGMHWFNPSHLILLIEIIKGDETSDQTAETVKELCLKINKKPVIVNKDVPGFVANRIQFTILREALDLVDKGVISPEGIDDIMKYGLGFRYACLGPLEVADFGGLDTFYHISEYLMPDLCDDKDVPTLMKDAYEKGDYGVKTLKGFYDYSDGKDKAAINERNKKLNTLFNALYKH